MAEEKPAFINIRDSIKTENKNIPFGENIYRSFLLTIPNVILNILRSKGKINFDYFCTYPVNQELSFSSISIDLILYMSIRNHS
jgi:hypothetical protein